MSKKQWLALLALYVLYLLLGALVFQAVEAPFALKKKLEKVKIERELQQMALEAVGHLSDNDPLQAQFVVLLERASEEYGPLLPRDINITNATTGRELNGIAANITQAEVVIEDDWDLWNTFFFTFITITTIGYGHLYPHTGFGQGFCIVYSLFGIPLNTLVFVTLAGFYSEYVLTDEDRKGGNGRSSRALVLRALLYLLPGVALFLVVPAVVVMFFEKWTFLQSFYFAFISLTTIGYGDFVAGHPSHYLEGWDVVYKGYIMLWTMFGLSYIIMVITFLIDAFKSDKIRSVERTTSRLLKKRTDRLQRLVNSLVIQHQQDRQSRKEKLSSSVVAVAAQKTAGLDNAGFTLTEPPASVVTNGISPGRHVPDGNQHCVVENSTGKPNPPDTGSTKPAQRRKSIIEAVAKILPENHQLTARKISRASLRRPSIQIDLDANSSAELKTLADIVAAVDDLVEAAEILEETTNEEAERVAQVTGGSDCVKAAEEGQNATKPANTNSKSGDNAAPENIDLTLKAS